MPTAHTDPSQACKHELQSTFVYSDILEASV